MFSIAICDDQHDQLKAIGKALDSYAASHPGMEIEPEFFANPREQRTQEYLSGRFS